MARRKNPDRVRFPRRDTFPIDVRDTGDEYVLTADLPGVRTRDIDVNARGDTIQIVAERADRPPGRSRRPDRTSQPLVRTIRLPRRIDSRRVHAAYTGGVLRVHARKRRPPRKLDIT